MRIATPLSALAAVLLLSPAASAQIVFNEVLYDPGADVATGDANGNGIRESAGDEFIELVNSGATPFDLSGYVIEDAASFASADPLFVRHTFPAGTVVPANGAIVVFGRENDTNPLPTGTFGNAIVQQSMSPSRQLGLNNTSETIYLLDPQGATVLQLVTGADAPQDQSIARNPDLVGAEVGHQSIATNPVRFSPGLQNANGLAFPGSATAGEEGPTGGTLALRVQSPASGVVAVRFELPEAADVRLAAYDLLGREVAVLAEGALAAGAASASLDASALAPGVYVLRLTAGAAVTARTLTVAR